MKCFRKKQFFVTFRVCYMRNNLAWLGEYLTHLDVADMSNLFYFHFLFTWSRAMTRLPRSNSGSLARRSCECSCTSFNNKELNLFLSRGYEHVSSLARWSRFYINTKTYYSTYWASPSIGVFFQYKHPASK